MPLINCEISLILTSSENCADFFATGKTKFAITDTKLYVPVVTLSTKHNAKLLKQLESVLKEQLIGINFTFSYKIKNKIDILIT